MSARRRQDLLFRVIDREAVVYDRERKAVHRLNPTATFIWEHCDGTRSASDLATLLAKTYHIETAAARGDVEGVLRRLDREGLLAPEDERA